METSLQRIVDFPLVIINLNYKEQSEMIMLKTLMSQRMQRLSRPVQATTLRMIMFRPFSTSDDQKVSFKIIDDKDTEYQVEAEIGQNMMRAGIYAKVPFAEACGGNAECCTCHCFFPEEIMEGQDYEEPEEKELDALDFCEGVTEVSRLACQVKVTKDFHGHTFRLVEMD